MKTSTENTHVALLESTVSIAEPFYVYDMSTGEKMYATVSALQYYPLSFDI